MSGATLLGHPMAKPDAASVSLPAKKVDEPSFEFTAVLVGVLEKQHSQLMQEFNTDLWEFFVKLSLGVVRFFVRTI